MNIEISKDRVLHFEVSALNTSKEEVEKVKEAIARGIGPRNPPPVIKLRGMDRKHGDRFSIQFSICGPAFIDFAEMENWVASTGLKRFSIDEVPDWFF